jgi:hypothetical protein
MKIFILFCIVFSGVICEENKSDCISNYFEASKASKKLPEICDNLIKNNTNQFKNEIKLLFEPGYNQTCILNSFEEFKIVDLYLKGIKFHLINKTDEKEFKENVKNSIRKFLQMFLYRCNVADELDTVFDDPKFPQQQKMRDSHLTKCQKVYLLEKNIIDPTEFGIDISSIKVSNCNEIVADLERAVKSIQTAESEEVFEMKDDAARLCAHQKSMKNNWVLKKISFQIIATFELTKEQREDLRVKLIQWEKSMTSEFLQCYQEMI